MDAKRLKPGGILEFYADFGKNKAYYVDKTLFIKQVLCNPCKVQLYTRPRRFGKTLSLTTLHAFLANHDYLGFPRDYKPYFEGKKIMQCGDEILSKMGNNSVIFLSLKECCKSTFEQSLTKFADTVGECSRSFRFVTKSNDLEQEERDAFKRIASEKASQNDLEKSLRTLCNCIKAATGKLPYILIDEYDVPLNSAYHYGYYDEMVAFIQSLFSCGLKSNDNFEKAVLTGCLRISKESIFTGFNNLRVYSIDSEMDDEYFGFTKDEVMEMLNYYDLTDHYDAIKDWYDSYQFGSRLVYNPFSLVQCVDNLTLNDKNAIRCYWTNSSGNDIIRDILLDHPECSDDMQKLIRGESIYKPIRESMTYRDLDSYDDNIWTLLYFTGYIKSVSKQEIDHDWIHELKLVNKEIQSIFPEFLRLYLRDSVKRQGLPSFDQAIWNKDAAFVEGFISNILFGMVSYHDTKEMFYHGMMLGILSNFTRYIVQSNREEGNGRTDIVVRDTIKRRAVVFEFKWSNEPEDLDALPSKALNQVRERKYAESLHKQGFRTVIAVGIGFCEKMCGVVIEEM